MHEPYRNLLRLIAKNTISKNILRLYESLMYCDIKVFDKVGGNHYIYEVVKSGKALAIGKLGSTELGALRSYLRCLNSSKIDELTSRHRQSLFMYTGVFPDNILMFKKYCSFIINDILPEINVMGVWFNNGESKIIKKYCTSFRPVTLASLVPYIWNKPWTKALEGKRVLVIHPFVNTIRQQYLKRDLIWPNNHNVIPEFDLQLLRVPFYPALVPPLYKDWFETLGALQSEMRKINFDIALIGAGAYSLPLAVYAKKLGKQGIHTGGDTQMIFGIKGARWDNWTVFNKYYNDAWVRPNIEDTPEKNSIIESGCYW